MKKTFQRNHITIARADKSKATVLINKNILQRKLYEFLQENSIKQIKKDPTDKYQKRIHLALQKSENIIEKRVHNYLMNIKPKAPQLNAYIKTHKDNAPIRPVINHTQAPSHKLARHLNKKLRGLLPLPNAYVTNSQEIAEELTNIPINDHMKIITLDIKDLYVNLPTHGVIHTAKF
jgi:hypothetical protein